MVHLYNPAARAGRCVGRTCLELDHNLLNNGVWDRAGIGEGSTPPGVPAPPFNAVLPNPDRFAATVFRPAATVPRPVATGCRAATSLQPSRHVGVRLDAELEASLQVVARQVGCSLSACVRQALRTYLRQFRDGEEPRRQSRLVARGEAGDLQAAELPCWSDWT